MMKFWLKLIRAFKSYLTDRTRDRVKESKAEEGGDGGEKGGDEGDEGRRRDSG
jgi:hypothetical protein